MLQIIEKTGKYSAKCTCSRCRVPFNVRNRYDATKSIIGSLCSVCKYAITKMGEITQLKLQLAYDYNQLTGDLRRSHTTWNGKAGTIATSTHSEGYLVVRINKKRYFAHRIIFMYMTGQIPEQVDHENHVRDDNRWINLNGVIHRDNQLNTSVSTNSTTGINGVCLHKPTGKYRAYVTVHNKQIHLGLFRSISDAEKARKVANVKYNFHKNHGRQGNR